MGCQAVLSSVTASSRPSASATATAYEPAGAAWRTRVTLSAASRSISARERGVAGRVRPPRSRPGAPPARAPAPRAAPTAGSRLRRARPTRPAPRRGRARPAARPPTAPPTTVLPAASAGASSATSPSSSGSSGATTPTTPVGSGREKDRNGAATGLTPPSTGCELVGPAGVVHEHVDRRLDLGALDAEVVRPRLQRLRGAVEDLAAVVGRARRPRARGLARRLDGVAHVLARAARHVAVVVRGRSAPTPSARTRRPRRACRSWGRRAGS